MTTIDLDEFRAQAEQRINLSGNKLYDLCGHIPALLDEIEQLRAEVASLRSACEHCGQSDGYRRGMEAAAKLAPTVDLPSRHVVAPGRAIANAIRAAAEAAEA